MTTTLTLTVLQPGTEVLYLGTRENDYGQVRVVEKRCDCANYCARDEHADEIRYVLRRPDGSLMWSVRAFSFTVRDDTPPRANSLVQYHGSLSEYRGDVFRVLSFCRCPRCTPGTRYRLAYRGGSERVLRHVRPTSVTRITPARADEIQHANAAAMRAEMRRRLELAQAEVDRLEDAWEHGIDAARWTPDLPVLI